MFFTACSEKFNVAAPYKSIAIVWGFLDEADTAHYVRIQKAFLDENKNAITMSQVADSNYFSNINVRMERIDFQGTGQIFDTIHLSRVNMSQEGYPKNSGVFFDSPSYAYKFTSALNPYYSYRLVITNPSNNQTDSVETPVIDDNPATFSVQLLDDTAAALYGLDFASTIQNQYTDIIASYNIPSNFNYYGQTSPVALAQILLQFNWQDSDIINSSKVAHSYLYDFGYTSFSTSTPGQLDYKILHTDLYAAVLDALGNAPTNKVRLMDRCQLFIYLSTNDYSYYLQIAQNLGEGLTGNEIEPTYTNIKGANVLGLFTARGLRSGYVTIDPSTMDSLRASTMLINSKIAGTVYH